MISFSNIVSRFDAFATSNAFIKSFSYGSPEDVDLDKMELYPLMHLVYTGSSYGNQTKTYDLEVYVLDLPSSKVDKPREQKETISDSEQVAEDILADLEHGGIVFDFDYHYTLASATVQALEEEGSNVLAGVMLNLSLEVPYLYDACNAPLAGVSAGGSATPSVQVGMMQFRTVDSSVNVPSVKKVVVPNGSLTDNGGGQVTLTYDTEVAGTQKVFTSNVVSSPSLITFSQVTVIPGFTNLEYEGGAVTGTGTAGVTVSPLGAGVSITGLSTGNTIHVAGEVWVFQSLQIEQQDIVQIQVLDQRTSSTFYADQDSYLAGVTVFPQFGYAFRQAYEFEQTIEVVTHADHAIFVKANGIFGLSQAKLKELTITIQQ